MMNFVRIYEIRQNGQIFIANNEIYNLEIKKIENLFALDQKRSHLCINHYYSIYNYIHVQMLLEHFT